MKHDIKIIINMIYQYDTISHNILYHNIIFAIHFLCHATLQYVKPHVAT